jgi:hypothetical protein
MAVKRRTCCMPWWSTRQQPHPCSRATICGVSRVSRPMALMAMAQPRNGLGASAFGCKRPNVAKRNRAWARFAMRSSAAITSLRSLGASSVALIAPRVTIWDGSSWPHVSSCSAQVLSHDPKRYAVSIPAIHPQRRPSWLLTQAVVRAWCCFWRRAETRECTRTPAHQTAYRAGSRGG